MVLSLKNVYLEISLVIFCWKRLEPWFYLYPAIVPVTTEVWRIFEPLFSLLCDVVFHYHSFTNVAWMDLVVS